MELNKILTAHLDDIVFDGRNKTYGAYLLRKLYDKKVRNSFFIALLIFLVCLGGPLIWGMINKNKVETNKMTVVDMANLKPPPPVDPKTPPPPPPPPPPPIKSTIKFVPPVIKKDEEVPPEDPPKQDEMKDKDVSDKTQQGDPNGVSTDLQIDGTGDKVVEEKKEEIYTFVEQMPSFPGGEDEMLKFISKNLKYPEQAKNQELEGMVVLSFIVDGQGTIHDISVLRDIGGGCGQAAIDVVKKMPAWKEGRQNGHPVSVKMNMPIRFTLQ